VVADRQEAQVTPQDKAGTVYLGVSRKLWLVLQAEPLAVCLNLKTGEVLEFHRSLDDLVKFGWRPWEGEP
jgi:hypothetical protein